MSPVMCHLSCVTSHMSCVTCHMSHVTNANSHSHIPSLAKSPIIRSRIQNLKNLWSFLALLQKPKIFEKRKNSSKANNMKIVWSQPSISNASFDQKSLVHPEANRQTERRTCNSMTDPAQRAESVKIYMVAP